MKRLAGYFACIAGLCILFTACYYLSYRSALKKFNENATERDYNLMMSTGEYKNPEWSESNTQNNVNNENLNSQNEGGDNTVQADTSKKDIILPTTTYILETYELASNSIVREEVALPGNFVGMTREQMIHFLSNYMTDIPVSDYEKGLFSFEVERFSKEELVLRKSYNSDLVTFQYFVAVKEDRVIVYYSDLKTVYEYTMIVASELPETERNALMNGVYIKNSEDLISLLESYSS